MAIIYGQPSRYLTINKSISKYVALFYLVYFVFVLGIAYWRLYVASYSLASLIAIITLFGPLLLIIDSSIRKEESVMFKFRSGILGERVIEDELRNLDLNYTVFQDVKIPGKHENIDFVVVGSTGIYAVEVKNHRGEVGFNGDVLTLNKHAFEKDFLRQTMREATSLHDYLLSSGINRSFVIPIIVFSHRFASVRFGIQPIRNVRVIGYRWLNRMIASEPRADIDQRVIELIKATYDGRYS